MQPRLLFADDSLTMHRVVEITFAREQVTLITAYSGAEALKAAAANPPQVALIDMDMADMDGYTLCARLLAQHPASPMPVLLLGSDQHPVDAARAEAAGAVGMVKKPFDTQSLVKRVREALTQSPGAPQPQAQVAAQATPPPLPERAPFFTAPAAATAAAPAAHAMPPPIPASAKPAPVSIADGWHMGHGGPPSAPGQIPATSAGTITHTPPLPATADLPELPTWDLSLASDPPEATKPAPKDEPLWNERESNTSEDLRAPGPDILAALPQAVAQPPASGMQRQDIGAVTSAAEVAQAPAGLADATLGAGSAQAALRDALASALPAGSPESGAMAEALTPWLMQTVERVLWDVVPPIAQAQVRAFLQEHPPKQ